mmetsp:Transcript_28185/g.49194  ORF Transcript_28185/g.49194 Transcript_28185/m.49194 type:complete len:706 (+) Transcript_28185:79-2196(+)
MVEFSIEDKDPGNSEIAKQDVLKEMATKASDDPKSHIDVMIAGSIMGLMHPICPPEDQMFQLFTQAPLSPAYNLPMTFQMQYPVDVEVLIKAAMIEIERHDICRTTYHMGMNSKAMKRISLGFEGDMHILSTSGPGHNGAVDSMDFIRPFQLGVSPARFFFKAAHNDRRKSPGETGPAFGLNMHHIIADGDGIGIAAIEADQIVSLLFRGFSKEATMERLPPITVQFQDYAYWLASLEARQLLRDELAVWFQDLTSSGPPQVLDVPIDIPRSRTFVAVGEGIKLFMEQDLFTPILAVTPTTPYSVMYTIFTMALCRLTQQSSIYVAIAYGTRPLPSLYPLIGSFLNMLPAQFSYQPSESFGTCLDRMSAKQLAARKNSLAPFLSINNYVRSYNNPPFDPSRNPVYGAMLDMLPSGDEKSPPGLTGVMDFFGFAEAPGGNMLFLDACWNGSICARRTGIAFLNKAKAIGIWAATQAALGPIEFHSSQLSLDAALPELSVVSEEAPSLGKFTLKLNGKNDEHDDVKDEDCEVNITSGPEPQGVPDEYDFFRRSKKFLMNSGIMPSTDVTHVYAPHYQQPPRVKPKKGQAVIEPTPQSTEVDTTYQKVYKEPQINWPSDSLTPIELPHEELLQGEVKFYDAAGGCGVIQVTSKPMDDVAFTKHSVPIKEQPTKKSPVNLAGMKVTFSLKRGSNDPYATGLLFEDEAAG